MLLKQINKQKANTIHNKGVHKLKKDEKWYLSNKFKFDMIIFNMTPSAQQKELHLQFVYKTTYKANSFPL